MPKASWVILLVWTCFTGVIPATADVIKDGELRVVRIRACADEEFRQRQDWDVQVREHLEFASRIFEATFGIRFVVREIVEWDSNDEGEGLGDLVDELEAEIPLNGVDIVVGFSAQNPRRGKLSKYAPLPWGLTPSLGRVSMIRAMEDNDSYDLHLAVVHEIAHLFGAFHVGAPEFVMRETIQGPRTFQFDTDNAKLIRLMRDYDFEAGVESISSETAHKITKFWRNSGAGVDTNPLAEALFNRGIELYHQEQAEHALALWKRAIVADDRFALAYGTIGVALGEMGRYEEARQALLKADELGWPEAKQAIWRLACRAKNSSP